MSAEISQKLASGLNSFNEQLASRSAQNLYPGHGYLTGRLKASTTNRQVRIEGTRIIGSVGSFGIAYGMFVHGKYNYIVESLHELQSGAASTITGG